MNKPVFEDIVDELERSGAMLTREQVEQAESRARRQRRVDAGAWPITSRDRKAIVHGTLEPRKALRACERWYRLADDKGVFLAMIGERGQGKTVAACWLLAQYGGYYVDAPELVRLRSSWNDKDRERYDYLLHARLLVIDDLGTEVLDDDARATFAQVVNRRQADCKTMLTGNMTFEVMAQRYDERAIERIQHSGIIAELDDVNMRVMPLLRVVGA